MISFTSPTFVEIIWHLFSIASPIIFGKPSPQEDVKIKISPPQGILYSTSVKDVFKINDRYKLRMLILNDLNKIYSNCLDDGLKSVGYMYFIIGLSLVNKKCYDAHSDWISYSI